MRYNKFAKGKSRESSEHLIFKHAYKGIMDEKLALFEKLILSSTDMALSVTNRIKDKHYLVMDL